MRERGGWEGRGRRRIALRFAYIISRSCQTGSVGCFRWIVSNSLISPAPVDTLDRQTARNDDGPLTLVLLVKHTSAKSHRHSVIVNKDARRNYP